MVTTVTTAKTSAVVTARNGEGNSELRAKVETQQAPSINPRIVHHRFDVKSPVAQRRSVNKTIRQTATSVVKHQNTEVRPQSLKEAP